MRHEEARASCKILFQNSSIHFLTPSNFDGILFTKVLTHCQFKGSVLRFPAMQKGTWMHLRAPCFKNFLGRPPTDTKCGRGYPSRTLPRSSCMEFSCYDTDTSCMLPLPQIVLYICEHLAMQGRGQKSPTQCVILKNLVMSNAKTHYFDWLANNLMQWMETLIKRAQTALGQITTRVEQNCPLILNVKFTAYYPTEFLKTALWQITTRVEQNYPLILNVKFTAYHPREFLK